MEVDGPLLCGPVQPTRLAVADSSKGNASGHDIRIGFIIFEHAITFPKPQSYLYESSNHWNILKSQSFQFFYDPSFQVNYSNRHCQV